jgi:hypothetical protein
MYLSTYQYNKYLVKHCFSLLDYNKLKYDLYHIDRYKYYMIYNVILNLLYILVKSFLLWLLERKYAQQFKFFSCCK